MGGVFEGGVQHRPGRPGPGVEELGRLPVRASVPAGRSGSPGSSPGAAHPVGAVHHRRDPRRAGPQACGAAPAGPAEAARVGPQTRPPPRGRHRPDHVRDRAPRRRPLVRRVHRRGRPRRTQLRPGPTRWSAWTSASSTWRCCPPASWCRTRAPGRRAARGCARSAGACPAGSARTGAPASGRRSGGSAPRARLGRAHARVANLRRDGLHKLTTRLAREYGTVVVEDLNVAGMLRQPAAGPAHRRRRVRRTPPATGLQDRVERRPAGRGRPLVSVLEDLLGLRRGESQAGPVRARPTPVPAAAWSWTGTSTPHATSPRSRPEATTAGSGPVAGRGADHKTRPGGQVAVKRQPGTATAGQDRDRPTARRDFQPRTHHSPLRGNGADLRARRLRGPGGPEPRHRVPRPAVHPGHRRRAGHAPQVPRGRPGRPAPGRDRPGPAWRGGRLHPGPPAARGHRRAVLRAVEGPLAGVRGLRPEETRYEGAAENLPGLWVAVRAAVRQVVDEVSLAEIVSGRLPAHVRKLTAPPGRLGAPLTLTGPDRGTPSRAAAPAWLSGTPPRVAAPLRVAAPARVAAPTGLAAGPSRADSFATSAP